MIKTVVTQCDIGGERVATLVICTSTKLVHPTWVSATLPLIRLCVQSKYEALYALEDDMKITFDLGTRCRDRKTFRNEDIWMLVDDIEMVLSPREFLNQI